jgi:hypothetical protein
MFWGLGIIEFGDMLQTSRRRGKTSMAYNPPIGSRPGSYGSEARCELLSWREDLELDRTCHYVRTGISCKILPGIEKSTCDFHYRLDLLRFELLVDGAVSFRFLDQRICSDLEVLLAKRRPNSFSISSQASPLATKICKTSSSAAE